MTDRTPMQRALDRDTQVEELARENERLLEALATIKWKSADKDNMEFVATITCFQHDEIRAALTGKEQK